MKILVTGGAGFIGSNLTKKLIDRGDQVVIVDNFNDYYDPQLKEDRIKKFLKGYKFTPTPKKHGAGKSLVCGFKLYRGDIRDEKLLDKIFKKEKIDKVVHLAAMAGVRYSIENPLLYANVNVLGTLNLLEMSKKFKIKNFVYASSSSVYGVNKKVPFSETDSVDNPISPYAATKKATELLAHVYSYTHSMNTTGLRFFTVYGPWGRPDMAYFKFTKNIIEGKIIDVYNKGNMLRDFTYIDDIIDGTMKVLDADLKYEVINIGADKPEKLSDFIDTIEKSIGTVAKKNFMPMQQGDVPRTMADIKKLRKLGWKPTTRIEKGIKNFVEWYKEYYKI